MTMPLFRLVTVLMVLVVIALLVVQRYRSGRDGLVVFISSLPSMPPTSLPVGEPVVIDRGELYADSGGGAWQTTVISSATCITIINETDLGRTYRRQEFFIPRSELPYALPGERRMMMMMIDGWLRLEPAGAR